MHRWRQSSSMFLDILSITFIIILCTVMHSCEGMERIKRLQSRNIKVRQGDTVKLEWTVSVSSDQLVLFNCGYKNNALNPTSSTDPPLVTLAYGLSLDEFKNIRLADGNTQNQLRASDSLHLTPLTLSYHDELKGSHVMEIKNVPLTVEQARLGCQLKWKVNGKTETVQGGETKIIILDKRSPCTGAIESSRVRGEIFLGAVLFDILLIVVIMSVSLLWNRKNTGFQVPKKAPKSKKIKKQKREKRNKKEKKDRDVEKGGNEAKKINKASTKDSPKATNKSPVGDKAAVPMVRSERSKMSSSRARERKDGTSGKDGSGGSGGGGVGAKRRVKQSDHGVESNR